MRQPFALSPALVALLLAAAGCRPATPPATPRPLPVAAPALIPAPLLVELADSGRFEIDTATRVTIAADASAEVERVANRMAARIGPESPRIALRLAPGEQPRAGSIHLELVPGAIGGSEGYALQVMRDRVLLTASTPNGLFYGVQTLRQLLPVSAEHPAALNRRLSIPLGRIVDTPRFAWRGAMLDVARHFRTVDEVKRYIDVISFYKVNRLHLHLSDDQGWRIEIRSWPNLALHGGSTQVGGAKGGYYTQAQYADIVAYAAEHAVTIVPEIDMPGHTNAALASYPELNCSGEAPPLYTGIRVGFSALCVDRDTTYAFVRDVVHEIASLTPGPWFHIGGDEVEKLTPAQYRAFIGRVDSIVRRAGKITVGWGEIAPAPIEPTTIVQSWKRDSSILHARRGGRVILSPGSRAYLDMKYDSATHLGLRWAGLVPLRSSYDWEPTAFVAGVGEGAVLGVEAPLWSETLVTLDDVEHMAFPRLIAIAEVGWTAAPRRSWEDFRARLGQHAARLAAMGVNFYRAPDVDWKH